MPKKIGKRPFSGNRKARTSEASGRLTKSGKPYAFGKFKRVAFSSGSVAYAMPIGGGCGYAPDGTPYLT